MERVQMQNAHRMWVFFIDNRSILNTQRHFPWTQIFFKVWSRYIASNDLKYLIEVYINF